jgi:hypothetical protein
MKLQSAMEYLMTYGWAILIIAVVLGVLFQMGVFNSSSLSVRVPPGACKVLRTSAATNLVGQCSGMLPKYVAQFDGQSSYISTGITGLPLSSTPRSVFAWVYNTAACSFYCAVQSWGIPASGYPYSSELAVYAGQVSFNIYNVQLLGSTVPLNTWVFIGYTYSSGSTATVYLNNVATTGSLGATPNTQLSSSAYIGQREGGGLYFPGLIADVQIYNTSLDSTSVTALYQEGIGGAPVNPQYLVGWWPLNGDTKDYSGNNNNGAPTAITYTSQYGK